MSIGMLQNPRKAHDVLDDCESLFWAYLYGALHGYCHGTGHHIDLKMFDEQTTNERHPSVKVGGQLKRAMLPLLAAGGLQFTSSALTDLVKSIAEHWNDLYILQDRVRQLEIKNARSQSQEEELEDSLDLDLAAEIGKPGTTTRNYNRSSAAVNAELLVAYDELKDLREELSDTMRWARLFSKATKRTSGWTDDACEEDPYPPQTQSVTTKMEHTSQQTTHLTAGQMEEFEGRVEGMVAAEKARALAVASVAARANKPPTNDVRPILVGPEDVVLDDRFRYIFGLDPAPSKTAWSGSQHPPLASPLSSAAQPASWSLSSSIGGSKRSLSDDQDLYLDNDLSEDDDEPVSYPASKKPRKDVGLLFPATGRGGTGASGSNDVFE